MPPAEEASTQYTRSLAPVIWPPTLTVNLSRPSLTGEPSALKLGADPGTSPPDRLIWVSSVGVMTAVVLTVIVFVAEVDPSPLVAVKVAVNVPVWSYVYEGDCAVDVPTPSPKSQAQLVGEPVLVSVKFTVSGAVPVIGVAVKLAVGADGWLTVIVLEAELDPCVLVTVRVAVKVPVSVYSCEGEGEVDVPPSPKFQAQLVGEPVLVSVKFTVSGTVPEVGVAVKPAVGPGPPGPLTSNTKTAWNIGLDDDRLLVSAPSVMNTCSPMTSTARVSRRPNPVRLMPFHPGRIVLRGHRHPVEALTAVDGQQVAGRVIEVHAVDLREPRDRERGPERVRGEVIGAEGSRC